MRIRTSKFKAMVLSWKMVQCPLVGLVVPQALCLPADRCSYPNAHEMWVERRRSQIKVAKMSFLCRMDGLFLKNGVRSSVILKRLRVKPLLNQIEMSQLRGSDVCFGCLADASLETGFRSNQKESLRENQDTTETLCLWLAWEGTGILLEEPEETDWEKELPGLGEWKLVGGGIIASESLWNLCSTFLLKL